MINELVSEPYEQIMCYQTIIILPIYNVVSIFESNILCSIKICTVHLEFILETKHKKDQILTAPQDI